LHLLFHLRHKLHNKKNNTNKIKQINENEINRKLNKIEKREERTMMSIYISSPPRIDVISCFQALSSYPAHFLIVKKTSKKKLLLRF